MIDAVEIGASAAGEAGTLQGLAGQPLTQGSVRLTVDLAWRIVS
ncbi:hypothetical protein ACQ7DA_16885 [Zafaria sp. J156]|nr:hypothetical protein [Zafaria sp. J156]MEE1622959.1 hypothetical protein [Zafaria sp. J156]